jgi:hypothetical protein
LPFQGIRLRVIVFYREKRILRGACSLSGRLKGRGMGKYGDKKNGGGAYRSAVQRM